jgi:anion-transporting  ArsA/GET3 family ATPase
MSRTPAPALRSLLEPRLVIVTGKGGTGKTTVAASLALAAARAGQRVVVAEVGHDEEIPRLFEPRAKPCGYDGREIAPRLRALRIDPFAALTEYLSLQLGIATLASWIVDSRAFRQLMNAAPGWRELITLGKVWHLERATDAGGQAEIDLIVVDAPATGHGLTFLDVPHVVASAVRGGPLRQHSEQVEELLRDSDRTLLLPVALPEELPVRETAELVERLRDQTGISVDRVIANAVASAPFEARAEALAAALDKIDAEPELAAAARIARLPSGRSLAACIRHAQARHALHQRHLDALERSTKLPLVVLPLLPAIPDGASAIPRLEILGGALTEGCAR